MVRTGMPRSWQEGPATQAIAVELPSHRPAVRRHAAAPRRSSHRDGDDRVLQLVEQEDQPAEASREYAGEVWRQAASQAEHRARQEQRRARLQAKRAHREVQAAPVQQQPEPPQPHAVFKRFAAPKERPDAMAKALGARAHYSRELPQQRKELSVPIVPPARQQAQPQDKAVRAEPVPKEEQMQVGGGDDIVSRALRKATSSLEAEEHTLLDEDVEEEEEEFYELENA